MTSVETSVYSDNFQQVDERSWWSFQRHPLGLLGGQEVHLLVLSSYEKLIYFIHFFQLLPDASTLYGVICFSNRPHFFTDIYTTEKMKWMKWIEVSQRKKAGNAGNAKALLRISTGWQEVLQCWCWLVQVQQQWNSLKHLHRERERERGIIEYGIAESERERESRVRLTAEAAKSEGSRSK